MNRAVSTLTILLAVLVLGGYAIYQNFGGASPEETAYIPTLNADPQQAQFQALILIGSSVGLLVVLAGMAGGLAFAFSKISTMSLPTPGTTGGSEGGPKPPAAKGATAPPKPEIPLSDNRSLTIFWVFMIVFLVVAVVGLYWGKPLGVVYSLGEMRDVVFLTLPGDKVQGLPDFIAGPGDNLTALQALIGSLVGVLIGTVVVGFGLMKFMQVVGFQADQKPETFPRTPIDEMLADVNKVLKGEKPALSGKPMSFVDQLFTGLNVVLVVVIFGIIGAWAATPRPAAVATASGGHTQTSQPAAPEALVNEFKALPAGDAAAGEAIFKGAAACGACHSLDPDVKIVGPSLSGVATRAATRKPGYAPEIYLYESVTAPNAYLVEGFALPDGKSAMPATFKDTLKPADLANVVAFLLTKK